MKFNSLAFRLFAVAAAWTMLILPIAGYLIYALYRDDGQANFDAQLRKLLTAISVDSMNTQGDVPVRPQNLYEPLFEVTHSGWYWQIRPVDGAAGRSLVSQSVASAVLASPRDKGTEEDDLGMRWLNATGPAGEPLRIVELIDTPGHDPRRTAYSVIVAGPLDWLDAGNAKFRNRLAIALSLAGLGLVLVSLIQVRFGLLPLRRIEQGLASIRSGEASQLDGQLPAEIEPLQTELNALIHSNQEIIDRARTQVGNLAHALKTPLAVITNEAREENSAFGAKVAEQAEMMRDQVNHYLDRARMAARAGIIGRVTPVEATAEPLVRALERINRDKNIAIDMDIAAGACFQGEKQDLEEMLGNLLDNACKWGRKVVALTVRVEAGSGKGQRRLKIRVDDDGPGLTEEQRRRIGKRGLRLDESKPGSGLGLSIVSDLAVSYRGAMQLSQSPMGGLRVVLDLPAA
jgi:signal transduction histidine kinase